ncbi:helix-hairpin-helix domain-containing protein [Sporosarcina ureilytica]|uniref:helix-hairpin-helix domain-containing protein n=1 Tax=Sporosarcina ureilytica TaxID=298596 RepID=UPI00143C2F49|nr:helix-hairpin-helix domain-containing protein [Sporosarcina ureilytica]
MNHLFQSFVSDNWRKLLFPLVAIAVILAYLFIPRGQADDSPIDFSEQIPFSEVNEKEIEEPENRIESVPSILVVDVKGAVLRPGVYTLEEGDRLIDAINAAGGYLPEADARLVNLALKLTDELLVYIPTEGEELLESEAIVSLIDSSAVDDDTINLNTATEIELMTISGIGPAKAQSIIQYREENGPFQSPEELMNISGIGQKTFEKLQHQIKVK